MNYGEEAVKLHKKFKGKLETVSLIAIKNRRDLSLVYTPGVAAVSEQIAKNPKAVSDLTLKARTVAVISDGSAVLGLGNVGPEAALPVMEGKCLIFKQFAGLDAFPIVIDAKDPKEIVKIIRGIAPTFAAINLEDISAPECFEIERALMDVGLPVMHDDQHGTAIAISGPLRAAVSLSNRSWFGLKVVIAGAGAAGVTVARMLTCHQMEAEYCSAVKDVICLDSKGIIFRGRQHLEPYKKELAEHTNKQNIRGDLEKALEDVDVFIGLSRGGVLKPQYIKKMAKDPIIFAMANPIPEIMPDQAKKMGVRFVATGRSDFPNQINNALAFPGVFKGAIEAGAKKITPKMKLAAAEALSTIIKNPVPSNFVPSIFDPEVVRRVSLAVYESAS